MKMNPSPVSNLWQPLLQYSPVAIALFDCQMRYLVANQKWLETFGLQDIPLEGQFHEEILPQVSDSWQQEIKQSLEAATTTSFENPCTKLDGSQVQVKWQLQPWHNEAGEMGGLIAVAESLSAPSLTQEETNLGAALEASEARFKRLAANVPGMIYQYILTPNGDQYFTYVSPGGADLYELETEEFFADFNTVFERTDPRDREAFRDSVALSAETLQSWNHQWRIVTPSNKIKWIQGCSRPEKQANGNIIWDGLLIDITERKQAEEKRHEIEQELQKSEQQYRALAEREVLLNCLSHQIRDSLDLDTVLDTAVTQIRSLLKVDRCNFFWYELNAEIPVWKGVKEDKKANLSSLLGEYPIQKIGSVTQELLQGQIICVNDVLYHSDAKFREFLREVEIISTIILPIQTRFGSIGILSCSHSHSPRHWQEQEVELVKLVVDQLAIALNQSELYHQTRETAVQAQNQAQKLEAMLLELQRTQGQLLQSEKLSSLGQLVAGVAHEINNPVNFIYGNITHAKDYLKDLLGLIDLYQNVYTEPAPEIEEEIDAIDLEFLLEDLPKLLNSMEVGAERIREIVQSLRNFSRTDEAEMKSVNIHEGIDSTLMILQNRIKAKPERPAIELIKNYADLPKVDCYPGQLNQVFMNLIGNAIDALEDYNEKRSYEEVEASPAKISITTTLTDDKSVIIQIADNGVGIPEAVQQELFNPFFTTKPLGKGTGLGLSISYSIIAEKHRGELSCVSTPGEGAEFIIKIPVHQPENLS